MTRPVNLICFVLIVFTVFSCKENSTTSAVNDSIDYNLHIRPILSDRCFKCHGPDANQRKANLRLDTPEGAMATLKDNPSAHVIDPGHPEKSEVYLRISSADTAEVMPPIKSNLKLNGQEIELIRNWIAQGAKYKPHWAFIPPRKTDVPKVQAEEWPQNEIDNFILAKMEQNGLSPNESADKERLLKRISFDITGLPPSIEMQEKFLVDDDANAYEKMVDDAFGATAVWRKDGCALDGCCSIC